MTELIDILTSPKYTIETKAIYCYMHELADQQGCIKGVTVKDLSDILNISSKRMLKKRRPLINDGLLIIKPAKRRGIINEYIVK